MARLADLTDRELEAEFLEAERNALAWASLGVATSDRRGSRWMEIAAALQAEMLRRGGTRKSSRRRR